MQASRNLGRWSLSCRCRRGTREEKASKTSARKRGREQLPAAAEEEEASYTSN